MKNERIVSLFSRTGRTRVVLLSGIISSILMAILSSANYLIAGTGKGIVALQLAFTKEAATKIVDQWGKAGVDLFNRTIWIDYIYPIFYALFFSSLIARLTIKRYNKPGNIHFALFLMPPAAGLFDYAENTLHIILLSDPTNLSAALVLAASIAASIKWILVIASILVILYLFVKAQEPNQRA